MYSNYHSLKVLVDENMVSHCCWVNEHTIFGYFKYQGIDGYYFVDVETEKVTSCQKMTDLGYGDGHPSSWGDWIVFDTYPDKSRMQHLFLYNLKKQKIVPLLEVYHSLRYAGETRCDLHPRFSQDGQYVFFDSVYTGKKKLCYKITKR